MSSSGWSAGRPSRSPISSTRTMIECGSSSSTPSRAASRISSPTSVSSGSSVISPSGKRRTVRYQTDRGVDQDIELKALRHRHGDDVGPVDVHGGLQLSDAEQMLYHPFRRGEVGLRRNRHQCARRPTSRMHVDWAALGVVTVVSIVTSVIFTILLASGIRLFLLPRSNRTREVRVPR
jgi:hypothetical protein